MKIYVQVVDKLTNLSQYGMIEEPVQSGLEIQNALLHFGVDYNSVDWVSLEFPGVKIGKVRDTKKIVTVIL